MSSRELCTYVGLLGGAVAALFGGWDTALQTLVILMAIDYITGLVVAGVFHTSPKTKTGTLESRAGWKGLCRKGVSLLVVLVACRLDAIIGSSFIRDATVIAFIFDHRECRAHGCSHPGSADQGRGRAQAEGGENRIKYGSSPTVSDDLRMVGLLLFIAF